MSRRERFWLQNLWLAVAGAIVLALVLAVGPGQFARAVASLVESTIRPLPPRIWREFAALYWVVIGVAAGALIAWPLFSGLGVGFIRWFFGGPLYTGERLRGALVALVVANALVALGVRAVRDVIRTDVFAEMSRRERRAVIATEEFPELIAQLEEVGFSQWRGNGLVLRSSSEEIGWPALRAEHLVLARRAWPRRTYFRTTPGCALEAIDRDWLASHRIRWIVFDCNGEFGFLRIEREPQGDAQ